jgi:hypothetical protein
LRKQRWLLEKVTEIRSAVGVSVCRASRRRASAAIRGEMRFIEGSSMVG